jgi:toxin ParE1/3/4
MRLRFTRRATEDLIAIGDYLRPRSPAGAARVSAAILDSLQTLTQFPNAGRAQDIEGVRKLVTRRYSYLIYYEANNAADEIVVITIQHAAQKRDYSDL